MSLNLTGSGRECNHRYDGREYQPGGKPDGLRHVEQDWPRQTIAQRDEFRLGMLNVDGGIVQILSGSLTVATEYVGYSGTGTFTQTGGTNTITSALYLGI